MNFVKFFFVLLMSLMTHAANLEEYSSIDIDPGKHFNNFFKPFGSRIIKRRSTSQEKRDISLSYAATNINNKEGTQVKTITVIKNLNDKNEKLKIDPKLHENENWADAFKDNFDSYGIIPDVPDVDDLFEYVNKKHINENEKFEKTYTKNKEKAVDNENFKDKHTVSSQKTGPKDVEKPVTEILSEKSEEITESNKEIEKIKGDAELLPNFNSSRLKVRKSLMNLNYSTPDHSVHQHFENYVQLSQRGQDVKGYDYLKPCLHSQPVGSVTVVTSSGKTYNIPGNNNSYTTPYLAPSVTRRPQIVQQSTQAPVANIPVFSINSLVPPLQQQLYNNPILNNFNTQQSSQTPNSSLQPPFQNSLQSNQSQQPQQRNQQSMQEGQKSISSTSQRPYVSPNLRSTLNSPSRGQSSNSNANRFQYDQSNYRINAFLKPNVFRTRGLKY